MKIVFIVGASRSGTTMLNRVLGRHPSILGMNELHFFGDIWPDVGDISGLSQEKAEHFAAKLLARQRHDLWGGAPTSEDEDDARQLVAGLRHEQRNPRDLFAAFVDWVGSSAQRQIVCEQTPRNVFYAEQLLEFYPDARVVQLIRDPRAVLASQKGRWRRKFLGGSNVPWSETIRVWLNYHPITLCKLWSRAASISNVLVDHPRAIVCRFEDILADPEGEVRKICDLIGVEFREDMLRVDRVGSSNQADSGSEKGISSEVAENWRRKLSQGEVAICEGLTEDWMRRFGYRLESKKTLSWSFVRSLLLFPLHAIGVVIANPRRALSQLKAVQSRDTASRKNKENKELTESQNQ